MPRTKVRKVRLNNIEQAKVFAYIKAYQEAKKPSSIIKLDYHGSVFGELHFWR